MGGYRPGAEWKVNYDELGFRCGIEIHQQVDTDTKLFCECPVETPDADEWTEEYSRYLRSVTGESGEEDRAAKVESRKRTEYIYRHFDSCSCLVELDEEPPHALNREALDIGLTFARLVDSEIPDEVQVMRKIVVDGSNTTGFQRTAMVGFDGEIETEEGRVAVEDIELEEESAGIVRRDDDRAVYRLDRLGIPLIEVGTDASIQSPEHAREVAAELGMLLRSTGNARRGLGTIRQDVNVSIEAGARVEIKGFQDLDRIDELVEREVERQKNLVELGSDFEGEPNLEEVTEIFEESESEVVESVLETGGKVVAIVLPQLDGQLNQEISGSRRLVEELVDYAKSRGVNGLIHSDEDLEEYGLREEFRRLRSELDVEETAAVAAIAAEGGKARRAGEAVEERAEDIYAGKVPEETRRGEDDATTSYMRPLPGAARMYPETDIPPVEVSREEIEELDQDLPRPLDEREEEYAEEIGEELASQVISSPRLTDFEALQEAFDPRKSANLIVNVLPSLEADGFDTSKIDRIHLHAAMDPDIGGELSLDEIEELLPRMPGRSPKSAVEEFVESRSSEEEIRRVVEEVVEENMEMVEGEGSHAKSALMGKLMERLEASGETVSRMLSEKLEEKNLDD